MKFSAVFRSKSTLVGQEAGLNVGVELLVDNPLPNFAEERDYPVIGDLCTRGFLVQRTVTLSHDHDAAFSLFSLHFFVRVSFQIY